MPESAQGEEPGFETDVNEVPKDNNGPEDRLEDGPTGDDEVSEAPHVEQDAAKEHKNGGYQ